MWYSSTLWFDKDNLNCIWLWDTDGKPKLCPSNSGSRRVHSLAAFWKSLWNATLRSPLWRVWNTNEGFSSSVHNLLNLRAVCDTHKDRAHQWDLTGNTTTIKPWNLNTSELSLLSVCELLCPQPPLDLFSNSKIKNTNATYWCKTKRQSSATILTAQINGAHVKTQPEASLTDHVFVSYHYFF